MSDSPAVSVVLPVRDAEATIARAVASVLHQRSTELELIVVDDGSTDRTGAIVGAVADPRLRVLRFAENRGVAAAAEAGRRAARAEFVARMDADDVAHPERIARQLDFLRANPELAGCGTRVRLVGAPEADAGRGFAEHVRWLNGLDTPEGLAAGRFIDSPIANPSSMVRAAALAEVGGHRDPPWAEDYDLWLRLLDAGHRLCNLAEELLDWSDSPGRLTRSDPRYAPERFTEAKAHYLAKLPAVREGGVEIAGAGPIGKRTARALAHEGVGVHQFWEVNPRRVGETIGGVPVAAHDRFRRSPGRVLLGAVGLPGARSRLRTLAAGAGFREGEDFFCVA